MDRAEFARRHKFFEWWQINENLSHAVLHAESEMGRPLFTHPCKNYLMYVYNANHPRNSQIGQFMWHDWKESGNFCVEFVDGGQETFSEYEPGTGKVKWPEWLKWIDKTLLTEKDWNFLEREVSPGCLRFRDIKPNE